MTSYLFLVTVVLCGLIPLPVEGLPVLNEEGRPLVVVEQGTVEGVREVQKEIPILAFKAIPYAKPPKNELRFMAPESPENWDGTLDASTHPKPCTQFIKTGGEDCLYLNVYTPEGALNETGGPLDTMVYIHGGGFFFGKAEVYDKVYQMIRHDVIIVVIQYRLGVLGFFSTGDDAAPGNQGLMDQTKALQWVKANIAAFGGDPERITLFGQSAGAASTHFQILTPFAEGLFQRAIMQSGNAFCPWAFGRDFYNVSRTLANRFDCPVDNSSAIVSCLQEVNYILLNDMYATFTQWNAQPFIFAPRVDGVYIPDDPATLVREGRFNKVPVMMGVVQNEGAVQTGELYTKPFLIDSLLNDFPENGPVSLELLFDEDPVNTATEVYEYYLGIVNITEENADESTKMFTDRMFHVNHDWLVQEQANQTDVYSYEFDHRGEWGLVDAYEERGLNLSAAEKWISHSDDIQYVFERKAPGPQNTTEDIQIGLLYTKLFTNFAKYGTPTPDESLMGFVWPTTSGTELTHLSISVSPEMQPDSRQEVRRFWESLPLRINRILHQN